MNTNKTLIDPRTTRGRFVHSDKCPGGNCWCAVEATPENMKAFRESNYNNAKKAVMPKKALEKQ